MKKVLSILIPSYNMEKYLNKCLSSLIVEGLEKIEVLVINDGSKDSTSEIGRKYSEKYPGVVSVIDKENGHYGSCINVGLSRATGKYVKVLDADDTFDSEGFQAYLRILEGLDCDLVISDYVIVNENDEVTKQWSPKHIIPNTVCKKKDITEVLLDPMFQMHGVTYKTAMLRRMNYSQLEGIPYTDQLWMFFPMTDVEDVGYINEKVYKYLVGRADQTVSSDAYIKNISSLNKVASQMIEGFKSKNRADIYLEYRLSLILDTIYYVYLIKMEERERTEELRQLDKLIYRDVPNVWETLNNRKLLGLPYRYIYAWRRSKGKHDPFLNILIRKILTLKKRLS